MCFNSASSITNYVYVSLLAFIMYLYGDKYDKHISLFTLVVIQMQLAEYFMWKDQKCEIINKLATIAARFILFLQPLSIIGFHYLFDTMNISNNAVFIISIIYSLVFLFIKEKLKKNYFIVSLAIIISTDLILFSKNYVNDENFVDAVNVENPYNLDEVYKSIIDDKSDYRVLDLTENSTKPNYFFNSINGYHAAKLGRYNDVMDFYLNKNHLNTLSMLNTKYIIFNQEGEKQIFKNEFSSGSAWFVKENINVFDDDQEIKSLDTLNYKEISVSQSFESKKYYNNTSSIVVAEKKSDYIRYDVSSDDTGLIIFSEIFYPKGWKAYINDQEVTMERFNYILRGLEVPKGKHKLELVFDPTIVKLSSNISLFSTIGFMFIILVMILKRKN